LSSRERGSSEACCFGGIDLKYKTFVTLIVSSTRTSCCFVHRSQIVVVVDKFHPGATFIALRTTFIAENSLSLEVCCMESELEEDLGFEVLQ
jgi:hypothetical protein